MATTIYSMDRGLPASVDAERSILGAILLDSFAYTQAAALLKVEDFSLDSHRRIYARIVDLAESGRAIDLIMLSEELTRHKEIEAIGGVAYVSSLTDGIPHGANIEHYVKIVKDKSLLRGIIHAANAAIAHAMEQSDDAEAVLASAEGALFQLSDSRAGNEFRSVIDIVRDSNHPSIEAFVEAIFERGKAVTGLQTFFSDFDQLTSGLQKSDLVIIAGRPSMGKTAFAMNIAENVAVDGKGVVAVFSLEMSRESLLHRMLCSQSEVDSHKLRQGFIGREDQGKLVEGLFRLAEAKLYIDDTPSISVSEMRAKCRRLAHQNGGQLDLIVVDYLQLMSGSPMGGGRRYENRTQEVSAISRGLKMIAKEMRVPVIALSQLSRAPESRPGERGREPQLSDLRESGSIEQDADVVGFIYRPEYYDRDNPDLKGKAKLIIAKQRNGPTDVVQLAFFHPFTKFKDLDQAQWI